MVKVAELVLEYVKALVWPLVTVGLVWMLRNQIQAAFTRMTRLETPAGSIEFTSDAREVRNEAEELAPTTAPEDSATGDAADEAVSRFGVFQEAWETADTSPIGALISAWLTLEAICDQTLNEANALPRPERFLTSILRVNALVDLGLSPQAASVFQNLRDLRNRAVHGGDVVTPAAAKDFVESARYVARQVYMLPSR